MHICSDQSVDRLMKKDDKIGPQLLQKIGQEHRENGEQSAISKKIVQLHGLILAFQPFTKKLGTYFNYGCHCFNHLTESLSPGNSGRGLSKDSIDEACKLHYSSYKCMRADPYIPNCDPVTQDYRLNMGWTLTGEKKPVLDCESNENDCAYAVCKNDAELVMKIWENQDNFDEKLKNINFSDPEICQAVTLVQHSVIETGGVFKNEASISATEAPEVEKEVFTENPNQKVFPTTKWDAKYWV